jgi:FAD-linked sulfhydryl oxidase
METLYRKMLQDSWNNLKERFRTDERCNRASCAEGVDGKQGSKLVYPPDRSEIGRANWRYVHARASNFPENPTDIERERELEWIHSFVYTYPCRICARDFAEICYRLPPVVSSRKAYETWWINAHNEVNRDLSKPIFRS